MGMKVQWDSLTMGFRVSQNHSKLETLSKFGLLKLNGIGILGMDIMRKLGIVIDLPNRENWRFRATTGEVLEVPASHHCAVIKASEELSLLDGKETYSR